MADLPPAKGYLQGEIERLPVGPVSAGAEFPMLRDGRGERGRVSDLLKLVRDETNDAATNAAKMVAEAGGSGRHSLVRSFNRARALVSIDGSETVGVVKDGEFFRVPASLLTGGGGGGGGDADTLGGQLPAYYLDWDNFTGVPATYAPSAHTHPISEVTGLQAALDDKAPLASPALTGNPTAPTQAAGNNSTRIATTAYTDAAIAALIASAPGVLDTLDEIAAALGDDPNFAATMTAALAGKLAKSSNLSDLTNAATARTNLGVAIGTDVAAQSHVGSGGSAHANAVASGAAGFMTGTDKAKLDGVASGATANSTDATLLARANHTGTQASSTISDFSEAVDDRVAALLVAGTNITLTYNDVANTLTVSATGGTGSAASSFSAHKNGTDQTGLVAGGPNTQVTFGTEVWDTGSNFASSTWTPPAGKVKITAQVYITGTFAVGALQTVALFKNGVDYKDGFVYAAAANNAIAQLDVIADANGTDTFDIRVRGSVSSGTLTVNGDSKWTFFMGSMI